MQMLDFIWLFLLSCVGAGVIIAALSVSIHGIYLLLTNPVRYFWRINNRLFGWDYIYWEDINCFPTKDPEWGICRVYTTPQGTCYYIKVDRLIYLNADSRVDWLTCSPEKYINQESMTDYITIEEFIRGVEELGLTCKRGALNLYIEDDERPIARVDVYQPLRVDTCYDSLNYKNPTHLALYKLVNRYTLTPLDKRKPERGSNENL